MTNTHTLLELHMLWLVVLHLGQILHTCGEKPHNANWFKKKNHNMKLTRFPDFWSTRGNCYYLERYQHSPCQCKIHCTIEWQRGLIIMQTSGHTHATPIPHSLPQNKKWLQVSKVASSKYYRAGADEVQSFLNTINDFYFACKMVSLTPKVKTSSTSHKWAKSRPPKSTLSTLIQQIPTSS